MFSQFLKLTNYKSLSITLKIRKFWIYSEKFKITNGVDLKTGIGNFECTNGEWKGGFIKNTFKNIYFLK